MAEKIEVGEAVLKLSLDLQNMQSGFATAQQNANGFISNAMAGISKFKAGWAAAAIAVATFGYKAVKANDEVDKSIKRVVASAKAYGLAITGLEEKVSTYVNALEKTTRFQDSELATSLNDILGKTRDLGHAMYLNALAADLSVRRNIPLAQAADMLGNLYAGNTRGLMMVAKELGVTGEKAEDAAFLFNKLTKEVKGAAAEEEGFSVGLKRLGDEWGDVLETIGKALTPVANGLLVLMKMPADLFNKVFSSDDVEKVNEQLMMYSKLLASIQKRQALDPNNKMLQSEAEWLEKNVAHWKAKKEVIDKASAAQDKSGKGVEDAIRKNNELAAAEKRRLQDSKDLWEEEQAIVEQEIENFEALEAQADSMGATFAGSVSNDMQTFFDAVIKGNEDLTKSFEALGKSMARAILNGIASVIEGYAAEAYAKAIIQAISKDYGGAAKSLAGGALLSASAGGVRALAANLKDGAFVTGGTADADTVPANIRKNEAVVPLDDPKAISGMADAMARAGVKGRGGNQYHIGQVVVQGASRSQARSAAFALAAELDKVELRRGNRGRRTSGA